MTHRYALAAVLLAALSIPAAAQQTTQPDTSKKASVTTQPDTSKKTTVTTSPGSIAEPAKPADTSATSTAPTTAPATMTPAPATPSAGASVTAPAPSGASVTAPAPSGASVTAPAPSSSMGASASSGATGQVQPTSGAVKVDVKVAPTLANTVKISADSAFALAKASPDAGVISSAELEMKDKALVYNIKMVKGAGASVVHVDAMTGEVVKDKKYGGLKATSQNDKGLKKLEDAKEDSTKAAKP